MTTAVWRPGLQGGREWKESLGEQLWGQAAAAGSNQLEAEVREAPWRLA